MTEQRNFIVAVTDACNLRCRYCYANGGEKSENMSWVIAEKILSRAARTGNPFTIQFTGGEPLLNFSLIEQMVNYAKEESLPVTFQLQTNATLITREIAAKLKELGIAVGISLDGRVEINDRLRPLVHPGSSTQALVEGVGHLRVGNIGVGITCVVCRDNVDRLDEVVEMAFYLGNVFNIGFDLLRYSGRGAALQAATPEQVVKGVEKAWRKTQQLNALLGKNIAFKHYQQICQRQSRLDSKIFGHCYAITGDTVYVATNGDLYPCGSLADNPEFYLGNIVTGADDAQIAYVAEKCRHWMNECEKCADALLCGGGCFARYYLAKEKMHLQECRMRQRYIHYFKHGS